jgi:hypothetical protein
MHDAEIHQCQCPDCRHPEVHPNKALHHQMNVFLSRLDEHQQRWFAALEAKRMGHGGNRWLSLITGLHVQTIRRGRRELATSLYDVPPGRVRRAGAGRPPVEKKMRLLSVTCRPCW